MARPEKIKTPVGQRLSDVRKELGFPERQPFAEALGVPKTTLGNYERGDRDPDLLLLSEYRDRFGVNINWLVTGEGEMFDDPSKAPSHTATLDAVLMEKLARIVTSVYRAAGHKLGGEKITVEAAALYNDLVARGVDLKDVELIETILPQLRLELKRRLEQAEAEPGLGKRSA